MNKLKIFISHNSELTDMLSNLICNNELYEKYDIILPHIDGHYLTKTDIVTSDLMVVIASKLSFGVGVEVGWAYSADIPIYVIKTEDVASKSLELLSLKTYEYDVESGIIGLLESIISSYNNCEE